MESLGCERMGVRWRGAANGTAPDGSIKRAHLEFKTIAYRCLVNRAFAPNEIVSLVMGVSGLTKDEIDVARSLRGDNAQSFIGVIDRVRLTLACHLRTD